MVVAVIIHDEQHKLISHSIDFNSIYRSAVLVCLNRASN